MGQSAYLTTDETRKALGAEISNDTNANRSSHGLASLPYANRRAIVAEAPNDSCSSTKDHHV